MQYRTFLTSIGKQVSVVLAGFFLLAAMLLWPLSGIADEAADIARLLELSDSYSETMQQFRSGEISRDEMRNRIKAIRQEQGSINNAYGRNGTKERRIWDKKVKRATKQHKKERYQAAQAARKAEQAAIAEAAAEAAEPAEAAAPPRPNKDYSQVHLPDEVAIPLRTTDVQGISYGMSREEVERILKERGYRPGGGGWMLNDDQSTRVLIPVYGDLHLRGSEEQWQLRMVRYTQKFRPEIRFDAEQITSALIEKYGEPANDWSHPAKGVGLTYAPPQPDYNVEAACTAEMERRGTMPSGMLEIHPMQPKAWQERGERDVKQRCPDQLQGFRKYMHWKLGIWGSITVDPRSKQISIEWKDNGTESRKWRELKEEQFLKRDSGPAAAPKF